MAVPSGGEATTYAEQVKRVESRVTIALSTPLWDAQVTDTFGGSTIDNDLWVTSIPEPDVSGGECNLAVYGHPPFEFLLTKPKWFPTIENLGFVVTIVAKFPDATPGYVAQFQLFGLEAGRGKATDPLRVVKTGSSNLGGSLDSYPFFDITQAAGDVMVQSGFFDPYGKESNGLGTPEADHTYVLEWDPDGGQDGDGQLLILVDGVAYIEYDNVNASDVIAGSPLSRVDNPNCVRPYGILFQYVGAFLDRVDTPSGATLDAENQLEVASVTVDELVPRARGYLTVTVNPTDTETVTIDGKIYTFQTTLTNVNGNVQIGTVLHDSMMNLAAAINLDNSGEDGTGAGDAYAAAMTKHTAITAVQRNLGGDASSEGIRAIAQATGTGGNSITTTEGLANGSWAAVTLEDGAAGEGFETRAWPSWSRVNADGDIDTAPEGERFDLDGETWAKFPGVEKWEVDKGRDLRADKFSVHLHGASDPLKRLRDYAITDLNAVGYWGLGESSGDALDRTANGNDGTVTIAAGSRNSGALDSPGGDGSIRFDGAATTVVVPADATLTDVFNSGGGSLFFMYNADSDGEASFGRVVDKEKWYTYIFGEAGGLTRIGFVRLFSGNLGRWVTNVNVPINTTIIGVWTYDSSSDANEPTLYLWDGSSFSVRTVGDGLLVWSTPSGNASTDAAMNFAIGTRSTAVGNNVFDGHMDELALMPDMLTAAQAESLINRARGSLVAADALDPAVIIQNIFKNDRFLGRPILIDTRVLREDGTATAWKRQICGIVESVETRADRGSVTVILTGKDRPTTKIDTEITRSYVSAELLEAAPGSVNAGLDLGEILADIVDLSDMMWDGDELGATDVDLPNMSDFMPQAITAGPNLLSAFTSLIDELGMEVWRRYAVSGTGRYGEVVVGRWILGPEHGIVDDEYTSVTSFSLAGQGAAGVNNIENVRLKEGSQGGVGHVSLHFDSGAFSAGDILWGAGEPGAGDYPQVPYPARSRDLQVSVSGYGAASRTITVADMPDRFGNIHLGGPGVARFRRENASRRVTRVVLIDHDWVEITDPFDLDDPDHTGVDSSELWVANMLAIEYANGSLTTSIELFSSDIISSIVRSI